MREPDRGINRARFAGSTCTIRTHGLSRHVVSPRFKRKESVRSTPDGSVSSRWLPDYSKSPREGGFAYISGGCIRMSLDDQFQPGCCNMELMNSDWRALLRGKSSKLASIGTSSLIHQG